MRRIFFKYSTGYVGYDGVDCFEVNDFVTDDELNEMAFWQAVEHASRYGIEMCDEDCEDENCKLEHPGNSNIEGSWEIYDPEKHDMLKPGGGKWFK